jgi:hypothetical protein
MSAKPLKERIEALEEEVARLKALVEEKEKPKDPWLETVWGAFANDPVFEEAMRYGQEYRESLRPKPGKSTKRV